MITVNGGLNQWWQLEFDTRAEKPFMNLSFNHTRLQSMSLNDAIDYTATTIASKFDNLYVLMSGGLDSEFVANSLYRNNIPFTPLIGYIPQSDNQDYFYAMHWCEQRKIKPVCLKFDIDDIRLQQACAFCCKKYGIINNSYFWKPLVDYVIEHKGHCLNGEGNVHQEKHYLTWEEPMGDNCELNIQTGFITMYTDKTHPGEFMLYTPELFHALINHSDITLNYTLSKSILYNVPFRPKTWPITLLRPETKSKILKICKGEHLSLRGNQVWTRSELLQLLSRDN